MNQTATVSRPAAPPAENLDDTKLDDRPIDLEDTVPTSLDDPVPGRAQSSFYRSESDAFHDVEGRVMRQLNRDTALEFDALTVRRIEEGVLVEGVVRGKDGKPEIEDLSELIRQIADIDRVENRLLVRDDR